MNKHKKTTQKSRLLERLVGAVVLIGDRTPPPEDPSGSDASPLLYGRLTDYDGEFAHLNPVARILVENRDVFYKGNNMAFEEVLNGYKISGITENPAGFNLNVAEISKIASLKPCKLHLHPEVKEGDPAYARKFYKFRKTLS